MALVSDSRSENPKKLQINGQFQAPAGGPRRRLLRMLVPPLVVLGAALIAAIVVGVIAVSAKPSLSEDPAALAQVSLPFGAGTDRARQRRRWPRAEGDCTGGPRQQDLAAPDGWMSASMYRSTLWSSGPAGSPG